MCRLLAARAPDVFQPAKLLAAFAAMAEASRSPDGDRQGDGWGVAWLDASGLWQRHRSLAPIWEERAVLAAVPATRALAVHARSASFAADRGRLEHNQPYLIDGRAFVFNGLLAGVRLPGRRPGEIGAQRLAVLLAALLRRRPAPAAIARLVELISARARALPALNLAVVGDGELVALSRFEHHPDYYQMVRAHHVPHGMQVVCSAPLPLHRWRPLAAAEPWTDAAPSSCAAAAPVL